MRVKYPPLITESNPRELNAIIHQDETFTPESLIAERDVLREKYGVMVDIRANQYSAGFTIYSYDKDVHSLDIGQHEFNYAVDAQAEVPEILFISPKGGALDPRQPLNARYMATFFEDLSEFGEPWAMFCYEPYLCVRSSGINGIDGFTRRLSPKYKRAHVGLMVTIRHCYVDTMTMWVEAADTPAFNREAAEALVFVTNLQQNHQQVTARLSGKPWLGQFSSFLSDFLNKGNAWKFTLEFAHALGYHPTDNKFTITFDERHSMTFMPPAVSDRS
jgi:hypothetical protein